VGGAPAHLTGIGTSFLSSRAANIVSQLDYYFEKISDNVADFLCVVDDPVGNELRSASVAFTPLSMMTATTE
jgi:hypothetical protein